MYLYNSHIRAANKTVLKKRDSTTNTVASNNSISYRATGLSFNLRDKLDMQPASSQRISLCNFQGNTFSQQDMKDRFYHTMMPYRNYLCVYGGTSDTGGLVNRAYRPVHSEIYLYDLSSNQWEEIRPKNLNRVDTSRRNHCGDILGDWLIVYGGLNTCANYLNDLQVFNFSTLEWKKLHLQGKRKPPALARSAMQKVFHRQRDEQLIKDFQNFPEPDWAKVDQNLLLEGLFLFGGQTADGEASSGLYILRPLKKGLTWQNGDSLCQGGQGPEARYDHSMCRVRENLVVLGGRTRTEFITSVYLLDLSSLVWTRITLKQDESQMNKLALERAEFSCAGSR